MTAPHPLESTAALLEQVRGGDDRARERLVARVLPVVKGWAHGRLPARARGLAETDDLVQITLVRALGHVKEFELRREGAFMAYLRRILLNAVRDEIRRADRRPGSGEALETLADPGPSLLEQTIGLETLERFEEALSKLPQEQQEAIVLRVEFGYSNQEIADAVGKPSANAARMMVARALVQLAEVMDEASV